MKKILKNTTGSDIEIQSIGRTVPASSQITIDATDYPILATEDSITELTTLINAGDIVVNDGTNDLVSVDGITYLSPFYANYSINDFIIENYINGAGNIIISPADEFGGFTIKKSTDSGFLSFMPNAEISQIIACDPASSSGVNQMYFDVDNGGSLNFQTLGGAGSGGDIRATNSGRLIPDIDLTSKLGDSLLRWLEFYTDKIFATNQVKITTTGGTSHLLLESTTGADTWDIFCGRTGFFDQWLLFKRTGETENYSFAIDQDGNLRPLDGLAGSTAYGFASDTNTGMYLISDDNLGFSTAGFPRLQIEDDGTLHCLTSSYEDLVTDDNDIPNKKYVDDQISNQYEEQFTSLSTSGSGSWITRTISGGAGRRATIIFRNSSVLFSHNAGAREVASSLSRSFSIRPGGILSLDVLVDGDNEIETNTDSSEIEITLVGLL